MRKSHKQQKRAQGVSPAARRKMSVQELAKLDGIKTGYIRVMSVTEAREFFYDMEDMPDGIDYFGLFRADGTPIVVRDSHQGALGMALGEEIEVVPVH